MKFCIGERQGSQAGAFRRTTPSGDMTEVPEVKGNIRGALVSTIPKRWVSLPCFPLGDYYWPFAHPGGFPYGLLPRDFGAST